MLTTFGFTFSILECPTLQFEKRCHRRQQTGTTRPFRRGNLHDASSADADDSGSGSLATREALVAAAATSSVVGAAVNTGIAPDHSPIILR